MRTHPRLKSAWTALALAVAVLCALPVGSQAAFPGTNGKLAVARWEPDNNVEIYTMNPDGSGATNVSNNFAWDFDPAWSADGTKIAFEAERDLNDEVYTMNADGSGQRNVSNRPGFDNSPAWSPDGSQLVFVSHRDGNGEIYTMNADGSRQRRVTSDPAWDFDPAWSPDGTKIAFVTDRHADYAHEDFNYEIYTINPDGTGLARLTTNSWPDTSPTWSPDGAQIGFASYVWISRFETRPEINRMNADGSGQTLVANVPGGRPAWSPDGTKIVFAAPGAGGNYDIYSINVDGTGLTNITDTPSTYETAPDWQPIPTSSPGPQRADYKNAAHFCKAERDFLGEAVFRGKYGGGANAHGKCVSGK